MKKISYIFLFCISSYVMFNSFANCTDSVNWESEIEDNLNVPLHAPGGGAMKRKPRIYEGSKVKWQTYPWLGKLLRDKKYFCVVFLITQQHFMTAGHCLSYKHSTYTVQFSDLKTRPIANVEEYDPHYYEYNSISSGNMAVGDLGTKLTIGENIQILCLATPESSYEQFHAMMAGWGAKKPNGEPGGRNLRALDVIIREQKDCENPRMIKIAVGNDKYCAGSSTGQYGACDGDDGGPLMVRTSNGLVAAGVITDGLDCGTPKELTVATRINGFLSFVQKSIGSETLCYG